MISQEFRKYQENRFDSFCRKVIRNACMDNRKCRMKREKRFSSLEAMQVEALELERVEDAYVTYSRTYKVKGIDITITDERIGEAIQFIMPNQRAVLLLSFFKSKSNTVSGSVYTAKRVENASLTFSQIRKNPNKTRKFVLGFCWVFVPDEIALQHFRYKNKGKSLYPGENRMNTGFEV